MANEILQGDCKEVLKQKPDGYFNCCVTSPPYWGLRDYGIPPSSWPAMTYSPMPGLPDIHIPEWTGCLGLEPTPEMFVAHMVLVFREVRRTLRDDGTLWLNFGDSYAGNPRRDEGFNARWHGKHYLSDKQGETARTRPRRDMPDGLKQKDLVGIPWRVAFALQADGWYLRMDNIWHKPNCMPESVVDRPTKAHEYMFLLSKSKKYYYDAEAIKEPAVGFDFRPPAGSEGAFGPQQSRRRKGNSKTFRGGGQYTQGQSFDNSNTVIRESHGNQPNESGMRNKRSVWTVATAQLAESHFATFPEKLIEPCILAGCPEGGRVLDPFFGSGTTGRVAMKYNREFTGIDLNDKYINLSQKRTSSVQAVLNL
ncbi:DNA-methyltransferase [Aneurinibacillus migulanus]|uniref:DNA-methyltransferase n=1 Tax=Aneurinibacillus migulanus TaxID=47500 RepID=UPI00069B081F|nr:site-specific DNA-methyltransferase [Aneurinibacillus migulanus]MED0894931.1 site-specific DNA-methyltransferase [Aneurinibacillus migulanus]MED1614426.1 site-specific DNA-methyltransferase [Aneurinibacillus migulanus]GED14840.1 methyltransferase [Aneurinibacillus migulanus]